MTTALNKTNYDTLTTNLPERGTREWFLAKRARKLGRFNGGGRAAKFREIGRYKPVTLDMILYGQMPKVYVSEYYFYLWNVGALVCIYCNEKLTKHNRTQDHVIPKQARARGVEEVEINSPDNLMPCCQDCNWEKADKKLLVFLAERAAQ